MVLYSGNLVPPNGDSVHQGLDLGSGDGIPLEITVMEHEVGKNLYGSENDRANLLHPQLIGTPYPRGFPGHSRRIHLPVVRFQGILFYRFYRNFFFFAGLLGVPAVGRRALGHICRNDVVFASLLIRPLPVACEVSPFDGRETWPGTNAGF